MPQSMQRAPCAFRSGSASGSWYSMKSCTRCSTGRFGPLTRWILRKPPISPIARQDLLRGLLLDLLLLGRASAVAPRGLTRAGRGDRSVLVLPGLAGRHRLLMAVTRRVRRGLAGLDRARAVEVAALADDGRLAGLDRIALGRLAQRALVVHRHDLDPGALARELFPAREYAGRNPRVRSFRVLLDERAHLLEVLVLHVLELDQLGVAARRELALGVEHVGDTAAHARGEVATGRTEHHHATARHVLAAVVAGPLDDRVDARVAHREALAGEAAEERPPAGRAVQDGVADQDVLLRHVRGVLGRAHRQNAAGEALARVVVGVAVEHHRDAAHQPAAEALAAVAVSAHDDRVVGQPLGAVAARDLTGQEAADAAVLVLHADLDLDLLAALQSGRGRGDDLVVAVVVEHGVLRAHAPARNLGRCVGRREQVAQVDAARLPVLDRLVRLEQVGAA